MDVNNQIDIALGFNYEGSGDKDLIANFERIIQVLKNSSASAEALGERLKITSGQMEDIDLVFQRLAKSMQNFKPTTDDARKSIQALHTASMESYVDFVKLVDLQDVLIKSEKELNAERKMTLATMEKARLANVQLL